MLVPGLPITDLAIEAVVANRARPAASRRVEVDLVDAEWTKQGRVLFAACYAFVVGLVVMAG